MLQTAHKNITVACKGTQGKYYYSSVFESLISLAEMLPIIIIIIIHRYPFIITAMNIADGGASPSILASHWHFKLTSISLHFWQNTVPLTVWLGN